MGVEAIEELWPGITLWCVPKAHLCTLKSCISVHGQYSETANRSSDQLFSFGLSIITTGFQLIILVTV